MAQRKKSIVEQEGDSRVGEQRSRSIPLLFVVALLACAGMGIAFIWAGLTGPDPNTQVDSSPSFQASIQTRVPSIPGQNPAGEDNEARERALRMAAEEAQRNALMEAERAKEELRRLQEAESADEAQRNALMEAERAKEELRRSQEAERRAREEANKAKASEAYRSPMIISETGPDPVAAAAATEGGKSDASFQDTNVNSQFLSSRTTSKIEVSRAERNKRTDALVLQGTILRGVLETAINTDLPGMVRAVTTEDVWSFDGRRVLIPAGSRVVGEYNAGLQTGQKRAFVVWSRLIRPDGVTVSLGSLGTDELGRSGLTGRINNHYFEKFGGAILTSVLAGGAQVLADSQSTGARDLGPIYSTSRDPSTGEETTRIIYPDRNRTSDLAQKGVAAVAQGLAQTTQEILKNSMSIQPTITIPQGTPIAIFVRKDLDFSGLHKDPVQEEYELLKFERRGYD